MRIEVTEETGIKHGTLILSHGDIVMVPDKLGEFFVAAMGWARDVEGKIDQAERQATGEIRLFVDDVKVEVSNG